MTRVAAEGRPAGWTQWIADRVGEPRRKYRSPPGRGLRRRLLRRTPKSIASRYYQLLSGHAAIGHTSGTRSGRRMTTGVGAGGESNRLATISSRSAGLGCLRSGGCGRILGKPTGGSIRVLHPASGCGRKSLRRLRSTTIGCINASRRLPEETAREEGVVEAGSGDEGEEGGAGSPGAQFPPVS